MEVLEEPELFDMEVVSESPPEQDLNCGFSGRVLCGRNKESPPKNVKRIIYIEEDSSDTSLDSDCEDSLLPRTKHTTQKIIIENVADKKQVFLKRKVDFSSGDESSKLHNITYLGEANANHFSEIGELLNEVPVGTALVVQTSKDLQILPVQDPIETQTVQDTLYINSDYDKTSNNLELKDSFNNSALSLEPKETSNIVPTQSFPNTTVSDVLVTSRKVVKHTPTKVESISRNVSLDSGPSSYYPSAFKIGLVYFSRVQGLQEAANLFRIPKEVLEDWFAVQDQILEQCRKDNFPEWERDLFVDVIMELANKETILLKDVIEKRKLFQPNEVNSENTNHLKWAIDWCKQFRFRLDYNQIVDEFSSLKLSGSSKFFSEADRYGTSLEKKSSPSYKMQVLGYAETHSVEECAKKYHLKTSTIRKWFSEKDLIAKLTEKSPSKAKMHTTQLRHETLESELFQWYQSMTRKGKTTRQSLIISKARSLARKLNLTSFEPNLKWYQEWFQSYVSPQLDYSQNSLQQNPDDSLMLKDEWDKLLEKSADPMKNSTGRLSLNACSQPSVLKMHLLTSTIVPVNTKPDKIVQSAIIHSGLEGDQSITKHSHVQVLYKNETIGGVVKATPLTLVEAAFHTQTLNEQISKDKPIIGDNYNRITDSPCSNISQKSSDAFILEDSLNSPKPTLSEELDSQFNNELVASNMECLNKDPDISTNLATLPDMIEPSNSGVSSVEPSNSGVPSVERIDSGVPSLKPETVVQSVEHRVEAQSVQLGGAEENVKSRSPSRNSSATSSSKSSVDSSYDSNSTSCSDPELKPNSLTGTFQQIFLKFARDGKQPINDQVTLMGVPEEEDSNSSSSQSNSSSSSKASVSKAEVQSSYILRKKTPMTMPFKKKSNVRKPTFVKASRLSPVQFIPPQILKNKITTISRRLGYSSAAGSLKNLNSNFFNKQNGKQITGKGRGRYKRQRNAWRNNSKTTSPEMKKSVPEKVTNEVETKSEENECCEVEPLAYPACFQNRVIVTAEVKGVESVCEEFGLQSSVLADWMHTKNSIKMLTQVENFQEWELDLYVSVHKQNIKGQKITMSQLISKGESILAALNLSDCYKFNSDYAVDWCERFGVTLAKEPSVQEISSEETESTPGHMHHRQKHSNEFMIEVCNYIKQNSSIKAHKKYGIPMSTLRTWIVKDILSKRKNLHENTKKSKFKGKGVKLKDSSKEDKSSVSSEKKHSSIANDTSEKESTKENSALPSKRKYTRSSTDDHAAVGRPKRLHEESKDSKTKRANLTSQTSPTEKQKPDPRVLLTPLKLKSEGYGKRMIRPKYPDEKIIQVLKYAKEHGINAASAKFKISASVIRHWGGSPGTGLHKYSSTMKAQALEYVDKFSLQKAARKFPVSLSLLSSWRCQRKYEEMLKQIQLGKLSMPSPTTDEDIKIEEPKVSRRTVGRPKKMESTVSNKTPDTGLQVATMSSRKRERSITPSRKSDPVCKDAEGDSRKDNSANLDSLKKTTTEDSSVILDPVKAAKGIDHVISETKTVTDTEETSVRRKRKLETSIGATDTDVGQANKIRRSVDMSDKNKSITLKLPQRALDAFASKGLISQSTKHSSKFIHKVVVFANTHGIKKTTAKYDVSYQQVRDWLLQYAKAWKRKQMKNHFDKFPQNLLDKYSSHGLIKNSPNYSPLLIHKMVCYANEHGLPQASQKYKVNYHLLHNWFKRYSVMIKKKQPLVDAEKPSKEFIQKVVNYSMKHTRQRASERFSVPKSTLQNWVSKFRTASPSGSSKLKSPKKVINENEQMEIFEKNVLNWCQLLQMNDNSVRAAKVIRKARHIALQLNLDDAFITHDWYKKWSLKHLSSIMKTPSLENQEKSCSSEKISENATSKDSGALDNTRSGKIPKRTKYKSSTSPTVLKDVLEEIRQKASRDKKGENSRNVSKGEKSQISGKMLKDEKRDISQKVSKDKKSEVSRKLSSEDGIPPLANENIISTRKKFATKKVVPKELTPSSDRSVIGTPFHESTSVPEEHGQQEKEILCNSSPSSNSSAIISKVDPSGDRVECQTPVPASNKSVVEVPDDEHNKDLFDIGHALIHQKGLETADVRDEDCDSHSSRSTSIQSDANVSGANRSSMSSGTARRSSSRMQIKGKEKKDDKLSVSRTEDSTVLVISDPGAVFCNWLKEVNDTCKTITLLDVKKKLEFIVLNIDEDFVDNWLFRLYNNIVRQVHHPKLTCETFQTVLGLDGYVSANVKLEMLRYAELKGDREASECFQIAEEKLMDWKQNEVSLKKILNIANLFITKNIHIDMDIYEWYLKNFLGADEVKEDQLRCKAQEVYHAHGGKALNRWFKFFLERFQRVTALDSIEVTILEKILGDFDCNTNPSANEVMSMYETLVIEWNAQPLFLTSELWFNQFCERYSDYLTKELNMNDVLPGCLMKRCEGFRNSVWELEVGLELNFIGSMEEIPFSFSSSSKTSGPFRNCSFSSADGVVLLACLANGLVLSPFVIFNKNCPQAGEVEITDPVLNQWLNKVWLTQVSRNRSLLILDSFSAHMSGKFCRNAESSNVNLVLVPPGCNSIAHPIVVGLSARFQQLLHDLWTKKFSDASKALGKSDMVSLVNDAYSEIFQESDFVRRSFQVTGMVQADKSLIGSGRYLFDGIL